MKRRNFTRGMLGAGVFLGASRGLDLLAGPPSDYRFVSLFFSGGWDVLLGFDGRPPDLGSANLDVGYDRVAAPYNDPFEVQLGERNVIWGGPTRALAEPGPGGEIPHKDLLTLFRGVNMNTVAHGAGTAYANTFRAPGGAQPVGSSIGTTMAAAGELHSGLILPNVAIAMPSFNDDFDAAYTGMSASNARNIIDLLQPQAGTLLDPTTERLIREAQDRVTSCVGEHYQGADLEAELRESRARVRLLMEENLGSYFDVTGDGAEAVALRERYGLAQGTARDAYNPLTVAAVTGQLLTTGVSRSVSAVFQRGLDAHTETLFDAHPRLLADGFDAIATLLWDLRRDDPNLEKTIVIAHSEFGRTPKFNGTRGRDHWFANTIAVFGGPFQRGVVGETVQDTLNLQNTNLVTGEADEAGEMLRPEHVGATLAYGVGVDPSAFRYDPLYDWVL